MSKNVTFELGPSTGLASRTLVIRPHAGAGDDSEPSTVHNADAGANETVTVSGLADNQMFVARLSDVLTTGEARPVQQISFHTSSLLHLGPAATFPHGSKFRVLDMEDESSSSSSVSSSSSSASTSSSSISTSSSSSSSASSVSTSSSSVSTSSASSNSSSSSGSSGLN